jgi:hypothetical protein
VREGRRCQSSSAGAESVDGVGEQRVVHDDGGNAAIERSAGEWLCTAQAMRVEARRL